MRLLGIVLVIALSLWIVVSTSRWFKRHAFSTGWQAAFLAALLIGMALGFALLNVRWDAAPTVKLTGYPFAVGGAELLNGRWAGGLVARDAIFAALADVGAVLAGCLLPLRLVQWLSDRKRQNDAKRGPAA
jgi:hypothetical protein